MSGILPLSWTPQQLCLKLFHPLLLTPLQKTFLLSQKHPSEQHEFPFLIGHDAFLQCAHPLTSHIESQAAQGHMTHALNIVYTNIFIAFQSKFFEFLCSDSSPEKLLMDHCVVSSNKVVVA